MAKRRLKRSVVARKRIASTPALTLVGELTEWLIEHELWFDAGFRPSRTPDDGTVILWTEGPLYNVVNGYDDSDMMSEFSDFLEQHNWWWDLEDNVTIILLPSDRYP